MVTCSAGSTPLGIDVVAFKNVGLTNVAVLSDLSLQDGKEYYVSIRGEWDFIV